MLRRATFFGQGLPLLLDQEFILLVLLQGVDPVHIGCLRPLLLQFQPVYHIFQQFHFMAVLSFYHGLNLIIDCSGLQDLL